jgi:hypothetical protein
MEWNEIKTWGGDVTYWISGIYKIVNYGDADTFFAYYMPDYYKNWGDHPSTPPDTNFRQYKCWATLESAQLACERHQQTHTPKPATVKRAAEVESSFLAECVAV